MALLHRATLTPSKAELVSAWLPSQSWFDADTASAEPVGAYRFDDPAGEVGIESHLFRVGDELLHVPVTYRAAPLPDAEQWLIGTMEHSVLGTRWVYDGPCDPVYRAELTRVIREADEQVRLWVESAEGLVEREPTMRVRGAGVPDDQQRERLVIVRRPGTVHTTVAALTGTWPGQDVPVTLATLEP